MNIENEITSIIATAHGRNKVVDVRDQLWLPEVKNYAQLYSGGIGIFICDYSKGTGKNSVTVKATLDPSKFSEIKSICTRNLGKLTLPVNGENTGLAFYMTAIQRVILSMRMGLKEASDWVNGTTDKDGRTVMTTEDAAKIISAAEAEIARKVETLPLCQVCSVDFSYKQERVNSHKDLGEGFSPVSTLEINRDGFRGNQASSYPWFIRITNFEAKRKEADTGKITYDSSTARNKQAAFINLSDSDMYGLADRVESFVSVWQMVNSTHVLSKAISMKAEAFNARRIA